MSLDGVNGFLDVESAALRAPQVGIANTNPQHILSVGSNLYVSGDSSDVLTVDGNVVCEGVKVGLIEIIPSYDLEAVANVGNSTSNTILFTNPDTGIVATGNVSVGKTLTVDGIRITAAAEADVDLDAVVAAGPITARSIQLIGATDSISPYTGTLQIGTNTGDFGGLGVAGNVHVGRGLYVDTDTLVADSTTNRVGIGKTNPDATLDVDGDAIIRGDLSVLGTTTTIDTNNLRVQDPIIELGKDNTDSPLVDLGLVMTRPTGSSNVAIIFDENADTLEIGYTDNDASATDITMVSTPLSVNINGDLSVTSNLEVGTANLFVDTVNSRVGIGTSTPEATLHVEGNAYVSSNLAVSGSKFTYDNTNTTVFTGTATAAANEIGYLDMSTSSASNNIHVKVYIKYGQGGGLGNTEYSFYIRPSGANTSLIYDYRNKLGPITPVVYRTNANDLHSGGTSGVVRFGYSIASAQNVIWRVEVSQRSNNVTFYPTNTGSAMVTTGLVQVTPTPFTRFDSNVMVSGNVGIGTTAPGGLLDIRAVASDPSVPTVHIGDNAADFGDYGMVNLVRNPTAAGSKAHLAFIRNGNTIFSQGYYNDTNTFGFWPSFSSVTNTPAMAFTTSGNVGIGTSNPVGKLDIFSGSSSADSLIYIRNPTNANTDKGAGIIFENMSGSSRFGLGRILALRTNSIGSFDSYLSFQPTVNGTAFEAMRIRESGNVGIGTTNPIARLHDPGDLAVGNVNGDNYNSEQKAIYLMRGFQRVAGLTDRHHYISTKTFNTTDGNQIIFYLDDGTTSDGTAHVATMKLDGTGHVTVAGSVYASSQTLSSDDRIKYNEQNISDALTIISQLKPQKYEKLSLMTGIGTWIPTDEEWENVKEDYKHGDEFGFIAQDIKKIPELSFLVHGEETRTDTKTSTPEEYSNLTIEEQVTYTPSYVYESNTITQEEYSNLTPEEQETCTVSYTKQIETQTPLALNYQGLFVVAIGAIKELKAKNDTLETQLASVLARLDTLENA